MGFRSAPAGPVILDQQLTRLGAGYTSRIIDVRGLQSWQLAARQVDIGIGNPTLGMVVLEWFADPAGQTLLYTELLELHIETHLSAPEIYPLAFASDRHHGPYLRLSSTGAQPAPGLTYTLLGSDRTADRFRCIERSINTNNLVPTVPQGSDGVLLAARAIACPAGNVTALGDALLYAGEAEISVRVDTTAGGTFDLRLFAGTLTGLDTAGHHRGLPFTVTPTQPWATFRTLLPPRPLTVHLNNPTATDAVAGVTITAAEL